MPRAIKEIIVIALTASDSVAFRGGDRQAMFGHRRRFAGQAKARRHRVAKCARTAGPGIDYILH